MSRFTLIFIALLGLLLPQLSLADSFTIKDIRVDGLKRISAGTVFNYLPVEIGDQIDSSETPEIIRSLYKSGFFKDVRLEREADVLVVIVTERSAIGQINIEGNKDLESEQLLQALKDIGLATGRVYNPSILDRIQQELRRQYFSLGKYAVQIKSTVTPLERNRVAIDIKIVEGKAARIKQINIVGNNAFDEGDLLSEFQLGTTNWISFFTKNDQYSRQKLAGDLEKIRSYYLNRGYINFKIDSTQVSITPDKQDIYITINLHEGEIFTVSDVKLAGDLKLDKEELFPLVKVRRNTPFSRKQATESSEAINDLLGDNGYAFANVNSIPEIDEENKTVDVTFFVDPGKRTYVRRVNMEGNTRTRDEVLRRELRQMESGWFSTKQLNRSRDRLRRLGYFDEVNVETPAVAGSTDQVDIEIKVKEKPAGSLLAGVGFSQSQGLLLNASVNQNNFLGTGKTISFAVNTSEVNTLYQFGYTNPYYTINGVSRGFNILYRTTNTDTTSISNYRTNVARAGMNFGIPINEFDRFGLNFDFERTELVTSSDSPQYIKDFIKDQGDDTYLDFRMSANWSQDSRNRSIFPTRGAVQRLSVETTVPGSDQTYYRLSYLHQRYFNLIRQWTLGLRGDIAYGDGYGDTKILPPYKNYFAGGVKSLRGFKDNSLGPLDENGDAKGGNMRLIGRAELVMPSPVDKFKDSVRIASFLDFGNVFDEDESFSVEEIRYSAGVGATWLSPFGALTVSAALPLNDKADDEIQNFQFSFGQSL